jgi:xanthine dehydrogenase YagS FAD-binding subunit
VVLTPTSTLLLPGVINKLKPNKAMNIFTYTKATDVESAVTEVSADGAKFIAGGTNLVDLMRVNVMRPHHLVDIKKLPLAKIEENEAGGLRLGALVTNADTAYNEQVESRYPLLSKAILAGASAQLRNMASDGGNLLQRTRCYYFYDTDTPCNKREPGTGCSAINGYNRIHAIVGWSEQCIATHPSDMAVALTALEATVNVTGKNGDRTIPIADFHRLPGDTPHIDTNLQHDEIIRSIDLPRKGFAQHNTYLKLRDRASYAFALVSVAAALELDGDTISDARIALGGVAHKPWRRPEAEALLVGKPATKETFQQAAEALLKGAQGFKYNSFKVELGKRAIVRALQEALKM